MLIRLVCLFTVTPTKPRAWPPPTKPHAWLALLARSAARAVTY
jgi:hypothetical protein